jgi:hypothetical protein
MKNKLFLFTLILSSSLAFTACAINFGKVVHGNGNVTKELRTLGSFDALSASSGVNVYLFQGEEEKIWVEADENLQECVKTRIEGNTLHCYLDCSVKRSKKLNVYVNYKQLKKIKASSGADVYGETMLKAERLLVNVSSGADVKLETEVDFLEGESSSGADLVIKGKANTFYGNASSGADIKADELQVNDCKLNASSAGDIRVHVISKIDASASSGADISYSGNPSFVEVNRSSGGDIRHRN